MKKSKYVISIILSFIFVTSFSGCLVFNRISYDIKLDTHNSGTVTVTAYDMRSNATTPADFAQDKKNLFDYMWKSKDFIADVKKNQDKDVTYRNLELKGDTLIGKAKYKFNDISKVEGIEFQVGFYFLTLSLSDSVISTNGEIIKSKKYKRIMWDKSFKNLKFEMFSYSFKDNPQRPLAPYFKREAEKE